MNNKYFDKILSQYNLSDITFINNFNTSINNFWWRFREPILIDGSPFYPCKRAG